MHKSKPFRLVPISKEKKKIGEIWSNRFSLFFFRGQEPPYSFLYYNKFEQKNQDIFFKIVLTVQKSFIIIKW